MSWFAPAAAAAGTATAATTAAATTAAATTAGAPPPPERLALVLCLRQPTLASCLAPYLLGHLFTKGSSRQLPTACRLCRRHLKAGKKH